MTNELLATLEKEKEIRKRVKENVELTKNFSWIPFFAGEEFNQQLAKMSGKKINLIDFSQVGNQDKKWLEQRIKEIYQVSENQQLVKNKEYPIIWFKNIEKIESGSQLESALLPVFDPQQNTQLFNEKINLANYILVATSSTRSIEKLSPPLTSRLDCINVKTAEPKKFFLDKHYKLILFSSILFILVISLLIFWPNKKKTVKIYADK